MGALDKILDDTYSYLKARRWGLPIVGIALVSGALFAIWSSLPPSVKEQLIGQAQSVPPDDENMGTAAAQISLQAQSLPLSAKLTGTATAHVGDGGWMEIRIFVNNEAKPCQTARVYKNRTSESVLSATATCGVRLLANVPHSFRLEAPNENADALTAKLVAQYRR